METASKKEESRDAKHVFLGRALSGAKVFAHDCLSCLLILSF